MSRKNSSKNFRSISTMHQFLIHPYKFSFLSPFLFIFVSKTTYSTILRNFWNHLKFIFLRLVSKNFNNLPFIRASILYYSHLHKQLERSVFILFYYSILLLNKYSFVTITCKSQSKRFGYISFVNTIHLSVIEVGSSPSLNCFILIRNQRFEIRIHPRIVRDNFPFIFCVTAVIDPRSSRQSCPFHLTSLINFTPTSTNYMRKGKKGEKIEKKNILTACWTTEE